MHLVDFKDFLKIKTHPAAPTVEVIGDHSFVNALGLPKENSPLW